MADSADCKQLASLVDHIRLTSFPGELEKYLKKLCHFDTCLMLVYQQQLSHSYYRCRPVQGFDAPSPLAPPCAPRLPR